MNPFTYVRPSTVDDAIREFAANSNAAYIAGGTNLVDYMKMGSLSADRLIDINALSFTGISEHNGGVRIGALVSNTELANDPLIRSRYPVLSQATLAGASQQLRNMASVGGNVLSAPAAITSTTPPLLNAISAFRVAAVPRSKVRIASTPSSANLNPVSLCIRATCLWPFPHSMRSSRYAVQRVHARFHSLTFTGCPATRLKSRPFYNLAN